MFESDYSQLRLMRTERTWTKSLQTLNYIQQFLLTDV